MKIYMGNLHQKNHQLEIIFAKLKITFSMRTPPILCKILGNKVSNFSNIQLLEAYVFSHSLE